MYKECLSLSRLPFRDALNSRADPLTPIPVPRSSLVDVVNVVLLLGSSMTGLTPKPRRRETSRRGPWSRLLFCKQEVCVLLAFTAPLMSISVSQRPVLFLLRCPKQGLSRNPWSPHKSQGCHGSRYSLLAFSEVSEA